MLRADRRCRRCRPRCITPDDVGTDFDQAITSVDPEVDYLCYAQPAADRSSATEVDEQLFGPDGATEIAVVTLSFPDAATAATYLTDDRELPHRERSQRLQPHPAAH